MAGIILCSCGGSRRPPTVGPHEQARVEEDLALFVRYGLEPARVAPPTVSWELRESRAGPIRARVTPMRPEDAAWNRWPDGTARLFNNRSAHLFLVRIEGPGPLLWVPHESTLELNGPELRLEAAPTADDILGELTFWAVMQERWLLEGDLADRARAAGPFRAAYLPLHTEGDVLEGLVAFELIDPSLPESGHGLADMHVVALRLAVTVTSPAGRHRLVWVFD